jgi:hypothetical protein
MSQYAFTTQIAARMTHSSKMAFRAGWIRGMKHAAGGHHHLESNLADCLPEGIADFSYGYQAAGSHWLGQDSRKVEHARDLGLVAEYDGFWGQSDWQHPSP